MNKYPNRNIDVCILTDSRHVEIEKNDLHYQSILIEDGLIRDEAMMIQEFQVQDDFGGSVFVYEPSKEEIRFAEEVVKRCGYDPLYARVDVLWDNQGKLSLSELELIEPELWFRFHSESAGKLADAIIQRYFND
jgi:hypothetical protein